MKVSVILGYLGERFSRGIFWNLLGTFFTQGSVFITAIVLARLLGKETFGELGMMQSTLITLASIAQVSTGLTATKYVAEFRDVNKVRAGQVLGLCSVLTLITGIVATVLLIVSAPWMAEHILAAPHLAFGLSISAAYVLFTVINGYQIGALAGLESYKSISTYGALLGAMHIAVCVLGALQWGLQGAVGGMTISAFLRWGVYAFVLNRESGKQGITVRRQQGLREQKILREFMLPAALGGLTTMPAIWLGNAILAQQLDGYSQIGIYAAANNVRVLMLMMPTLFNNVGVAVLNNKFGNSDRDGYLGLYYANIKVTAVMAVGGAAMMALLSTTIPGWYGMESDAFSGRLIVMLSLAIIPEVLAVSLYQLIQTSGRMWTSFFFVALPRDISMIVFATILIPIWGGIGLSLAYTLSWSIALIGIGVLAVRCKPHLKFED
jgi:O-antigen/teichoic acid export membrane protein